MSDVACPVCGEMSRLRGQQVGDARPADDETGIEVWCGACGHVWRRDRRRCASCGGAASVEIASQITRFPRGTLLAVTGSQRVRFCRDCDAEVVRAAHDRGRPVPEGYVSRFLLHDDPEPAPAAADRSAPPARPRGPVRPVRSRPVPPSPSPGAGAAPGGRTAPAARSLVDPTVRQATEAYLGEAADADPVTLVMLGQHLGAATRLSRLGDPAGSELASWVDGVWGASPSPRRSAAVSTVIGAVDHWRAAGWLAQDLAAGLR